MAKYEVNITSQEELEEQWKDSNCPNLSFCFKEKTLDECVKVNDTTYRATYESWEPTAAKTFTYLDMINGGEKTYTLQPGEYGVKPS